MFFGSSLIKMMKSMDKIRYESDMLLSRKIQKLEERLDELEQCRRINILTKEGKTMTKQLFNGWIDGGVEPRDGCEALIDTASGRDYAFYDGDTGLWHHNVSCECHHRYVECYLPIPPHDKIATTGASVLEAGDE